ncbi:rhoGEF domain-containing protein gxcJ-like isoform X2 [Cydia fagiglandana]|uniref:rhoGEF domain-containing protein gxcJ-like isoform X2 n=1 Tax=Cydia fagiglandana TaxID=1458189 RepID=UPI002FEE59D9
MLIRLLLLIQILLIISGGQCAPKLGGILFEQLLLETFMDDENNTNANYKREFTARVPVYQTNIKNSTSLYAKLTGNSLIKSAISRSRHKNKDIKRLEHNVKTISNNSDFNNSSGITKNKLTTRFPSTFTSLVPLTTVKINTTYHTYKPEKPNDRKTLKHVEKEKIKLDVNNTEVKHNESQKSFNMPKSRRDGEMLQSNGYAFNVNNCQMRGDRVLCGYNNQELETIKPEAADKDCILRGDRIECGYVNRRTDNRRNNKKNKAVDSGSEIKNVTDNLTTISVTSKSNTNTTIKPTHATEITKTTNRTSTGNVEDQSDSSKFETRKLLEDVEKSIASIITNANTSTTAISTSSATTITNKNDSITISNISTSTSNTIIKEQPEFASLKIIELINRVEKLLASAGTITTLNLSYPIVASNESSTSFSTLKEEPTELLNLTIRKSNRYSVSLSSTVSLTNSTVNSTVSTTSSTSTSSTSTTTTTTTTTTTPGPYIDDGEYCVEKDGRIVCYDSPQEDYDDFLEK